MRGHGLRFLPGLLVNLGELCKRVVVAGRDLVHGCSDSFWEALRWLAEIIPDFYQKHRPRVFIKNDISDVSNSTFSHSKNIPMLFGAVAGLSAYLTL